MDVINVIASAATTIEEVKIQTSATMGSGCCVLQVERLNECLGAPEPACFDLFRTASCEM